MHAQHRGHGATEGLHGGLETFHEQDAHEPAQAAPGPRQASVGLPPGQLGAQVQADGIAGVVEVGDALKDFTVEALICLVDAVVKTLQDAPGELDRGAVYQVVGIVLSDVFAGSADEHLLQQVLRHLPGFPCGLFADGLRVSRVAGTPFQFVHALEVFFQRVVMADFQGRSDVVLEQPDLVVEVPGAVVARSSGEEDDLLAA